MHWIMLAVMFLVGCYAPPESGGTPEAPPPVCTEATAEQTAAYKQAYHEALVCETSGPGPYSQAVEDFDADPDPLAGECDPAARVAWARCAAEACLDGRSPEGC